MSEKIIAPHGEVREGTSCTEPFIDFLGIREMLVDGEPRYLIDFREEHIGNPMIRTFHGGVLAGHEGADTPQVSVAKAGTVTPDQVRDVVVSAQKQEPGLLDRISGIYAEHPDLIKTLGAGALAIALAHMKNNIGHR